MSPCTYHTQEAPYLPVKCKALCMENTNVIPEKPKQLEATESASIALMFPNFPQNLCGQKIFSFELLQWSQVEILFPAE